MITHRFELTDERLRNALAERAVRFDDELTSALIVAEVTKTAGSLRQRGRWWTIPSLEMGRWTPVLAVMVLLAALGATVAIGTALIRPPDPTRPPVTPFTIHASNGSIVASALGPALQAVDGDDGRVNEQLQLPGVSDATDVTWAPDGRRLAYAGPGGLRIVDTGSGATSEPTFDCGADETSCEIDWAPDSSRIVAAQSDTLMLVSPDGGDVNTLASFPGEHVRHPTWSPDSGRIAFVVGRPEGRVLFVVNRDGSGMTEIYGPSPDDGIGIWDPDWSPDGTQIAYISSTPTEDRVLNKRLNVSVLDLGTGDVRVILADAGLCACVGWVPALAWSPDGTRMALTVPGPSNRSGGPGPLYLINADGTNLRLLIEGASWPLAWQPVPE